MSRFRDFLLASNAAVVSSHSEDVSPTESSLCTNSEAGLLRQKHLTRSRFAMTERIAFFLSPLLLGADCTPRLKAFAQANAVMPLTARNQADGPQRAGEGLKLKSAFTLEEGAARVVKLDSSRKIAFTLAEVLITLGIIGVVAAMTMPTLINGHRHKVYEAQFKTAHSLISQAVLQMGNDNIDLNMYYCGNGLRNDASTHSFIKDLSKYFQVVKSDYSDTNNLIKLGYKNPHFNQSGPGHNGFNTDGHNDGAIVVKNGMMIASSGCWWNASYIDFVVDTNGLKGPNKFGYDLFYFQIGSDNRLYPSSGDYSYATTDSSRLACCNFKNANTCSVPQDTGVSCAQFAMRNTYPHDETKTYWDNLP